MCFQLEFNVNSKIEAELHKFSNLLKINHFQYNCFSEDPRLLNQWFTNLAERTESVRERSHLKCFAFIFFLND